MLFVLLHPFVKSAPQTINLRFKAISYIEQDKVLSHTNTCLLLKIRNIVGNCLKYKNNHFEAGEGWVPIGDWNNSFTGSLDGAGHKITGLKIDSTRQLSALFGFCSGAALSNLTIESSNISAYGYGGFLTGMAENTTISNCHIKNCHLIGNAQSGDCMVGGLAGNLHGGSVDECVVESTDIDFNISTSSYTAGGLIGFAVDATAITGCQVINCNITNNIGSYYSYEGGLVGQIDNGCTVTGCSVESTTVEGFYVGGLAGYGKDCILLKCYANTSLTGVRLGGLVCTLYSSAGHSTNVSECYSTGTLTMTSSGIAGGFAAKLSDGSISLSNCFSTSNISAATYQQAGGFVGFVQSPATVSLEKCYSAGQVPTSGTTYNGFGQVGNSCYWDTEKSTTTQSQAGTGKVTAEMLQQATFTGWDFSVLWQIDQGVTYPYLKNLPKPSSGNLAPGTYQYDANSKLQNIQTSTQTVIYQYDANGNLISRQYG